MRRMQQAGKRAPRQRAHRDRHRIVHWLLILGLWLQVAGPVLASIQPADPLRRLQVAACSPSGTVVLDLLADPQTSDEPDSAMRQPGHCLLCSSNPVLPTASMAGAAVPVSPRTQPASRVDDPPCVARSADTWTWPPVRCPPSRSC
ncbi:MAG: DUF2946 family protein [Castellaniella sp.]|uniref:DUF2946 family protein n=1 Tax=Castellaniella sp. TaxID=1955812 RepID=UPI003A8A6329